MRKVTVNIFDSEGTAIGSEEVVMSPQVAVLRDQGIFTTDDQGIFFQRQLEHIQAGSFDVKYPDLKGRDLFANDTEGGEGVNTLTYRSYDKRGEARIIAGKATDLPRADISGKEYSIFVKTIGNAYGYSRQELAASKVTGTPLDAQKANAARRAYEEKVNQLIWFGDATHDIGGLLGGKAGAPWSTIPNTQVAGASGGGNATEWGVDKNPDEVIADLTSATSNLHADTLMIHSPTQILMSLKKYNYIKNTPRSLQSDVSILNWFLANNDYITERSQIVPVNELAGVFGAVPGPGTGDAEGFVVLENKEENFRTREPFPYKHLPVQYKGLEFEINCYGRFAGMEIIRPKAAAIYYGI